MSDAIYGFVNATTNEKSPVGFGDLEKFGGQNKASFTGKVIAAYDFAINAIKNIRIVNLGNMLTFLVNLT